MPIFGDLTLSISLGLSLITIVLSFIYIVTKDKRFFFTSERTILSVCFLVFLSTFSLFSSLLNSDFNVDYVARYSSIETPIIYKFTAIWAGQSGSLLFWLFILSGYVALVVIQNKNKHQKLMPFVIITLSSIQLFFLILVNFVANPFIPAEANFVIENGLGLNPLLQNPTMAIHPPILYLGYVGFSVPFAFAIAALCSKELNTSWLQTIRRWTLFTWLALGIGILLGGWWAYNELGWGGYWAWDPVENASLMPWLTATAFIHSIIIQEKKNMLKMWNMILILITFTLCIFGTFLTRSGIVSSVHSFTASSLGPIFLAFVFLILFVCIYLLITRSKYLKSEKKLESFASRESGFLFNNVIFVSICFAVFWGTMFPVFSEAFTGSQITVGPPFFNQIIIPISLILLFLSGIGPLLAWRKTSKESLVRNFSIPSILGLVVVLIGILMGLIGLYPIITTFLCAFVFFTIVIEFWRGIKVRNNKYNENIMIALLNMINKNRSRYGGYIVHLGIVIMFIGFIGKAFDIEKESSLRIGESISLSNYKITLLNLRESERPNHYAWIADLEVEKDGKIISTLVPEKKSLLPQKRKPG